MKRRLSVVLLVAACAPIVGCAPAATTASTPVHTAKVDLPPSYQFVPAAIQVEPGTTVTWTNHDNFTHSVQVQGQNEVHMMRPGETAQIRFDQQGTCSYVCTLHTQNMRGTIVVAAGA